MNGNLDPRTVRLSENFLLSDFMGCHSVYTEGYSNVFGRVAGMDSRLEHGRALCNYILEPLIETWGPISISYGFISPALSRAIVTYQDPDLPSYHRWDSGAAADILIHDICGRDDDDLATSPVQAAHGIDRDMRLPYSRMITYSESPYICIAANYEELGSIKDGTHRPRRAFYENRYEGKPGKKPKFINMRSQRAKDEQYLQSIAMEPHGEFLWRGAGYPTYHGGGRKQAQHRRVSRYTMLSDWLFDNESVAQGRANYPFVNKAELQCVEDSFLAAGMVYDKLLAETCSSRFSIIQGYRHETKSKNIFKWRGERIGFTLRAPSGLYGDGMFDGYRYSAIESFLPGVEVEETDIGHLFSFEVRDVINSKEWEAYRTIHARGGVLG